ncbi:ZIP family metal transporter [Azohydromonas caseinilytica]|uniref:ZIP family metal transporter n=1 Tax=Azohydromonas caseinilytica TaxID=2728836 RepID=A0A848FGG5_9BURK|nr:ZIP family metal transporter [Azohydromonas caseinilytica]NML16961.1 ZIP family metal transporter [Azohydromonas caseinilytica]
MALRQQPSLWSRAAGLGLKPRQRLGLLVFGAGCLAGGAMLWEWLAAWPLAVRQALLGGTIAAAATALGTLPVLLAQQSSARARDTMLGFGAGVMLAASAFSLTIPGLRAAQAQGAGPWGAGGIVGAGIVLGALLLLALDRWLPHEHFIKGIERDHPHAHALKRTWLFVFAVSLHNLPEGLAIGVAFAGTDLVRASALTTGIAIQDVPEGLVIALALQGVGYSRGFSVFLGAVSGAIEPVGAVLGAAVVGLSASLLPWGLAFAAGAMLFVISHEIIPESHRAGHEGHATMGLIIGFVLMMVLDTALG